LSSDAGWELRMAVPKNEFRVWACDHYPVDDWLRASICPGGIFNNRRRPCYRSLKLPESATIGRAWLGPLMSGLKGITQVIDSITKLHLSSLSFKWGFCMLPVSCILTLPHVHNFKSRESTRLEEAFAICPLRFLREILQARARTTTRFLAQYAKLTGACLAYGCSDSCRQ
jgi:hypothetical protein